MEGLDAMIWLFLISTLNLLAPTYAAYDDDFCQTYISGLSDTSAVPYFANDYQAIAERVMISNPNDFADPNWVQDVQYSTSGGKTLVQQFYDGSNFLFYVDEIAQQCTFNSDADQSCASNVDTCFSISEVESFVAVDIDGTASIGTASASLNWPLVCNYKKEAEIWSKRGITCDKFITCSYEDGVDETRVSEWYLLAEYSYAQMDPNKSPIMSVTHHRMRGGNLYSEESIEYMNYVDLTGDIKFPLYDCSSMDSSATTKVVPESPLSFNYKVDMAYNISGDISLTLESVDYNYYTGILQEISSIPTPDSNEKVDLVSITDYNTGNYFLYDEVSYVCDVYAGYSTTGMIAPMEYWGFTSTTTETYMGEYQVRDIPVNTWYLEDSADPDTLKILSLATDDWLAIQGYEPGTFYPIEKSLTSPSVSQYYAYLEYKYSGQYNLPDASVCFDSSETIDVEITLLGDYSVLIPDGDVALFEQGFREILMFLSGIVTPLRFPSIIESSISDGQMAVQITILGKYLGYNPSATGFYDTDPVTSQAAADNITAAAAAGQYVTLYVNGQYISTQLAPSTGLFSTNSVEGEGNYSSGSMWAVGIFLLLIGLALGVAGVFAYARFFANKGPATNSSVDLTKLQNEL